MPRDSSGTYTRTTGHPVTTGTAINSSQFNNLTADIAAELTDSLSRSGKGGMTAPFKFADGTAAAPAATFADDTDSGFFRIAANKVGLALYGVLVATFDAAVADGAVSAYIDDTKNTLANAAARIRSFRNAGVEKAAVLFDGTLLSPMLKALGATSVTVKGAIADGATAVGVILDNAIALANATAKAVSIRAAGSEKAFFGGLGVLGFVSTTTDDHGQNPAATVGAANKVLAKNTCKAWGLVYKNGATITLVDGFNVASVATDGGNGVKVTLATGIKQISAANGTGAVICSPFATGSAVVGATAFEDADPITWFTVTARDASLNDAPEMTAYSFCFVVFGRQDT